MKDLISQIVHIIERIIQDNKITAQEIDYLQDWIEENGVLFIGSNDSEYHTKIILPLQDFITDGVLGEEELKKLQDGIKKWKENQ